MPENAKINELPVKASEPVLSMQEEMVRMQLKFAALVIEARQLGFNAAYVIGGYDPFSGQCRMLWGVQGDLYAVHGLVDALRKEI